MQLRCSFQRTLSNFPNLRGKSSSKALIIVNSQTQK